MAGTVITPPPPTVAMIEPKTIILQSRPVQKTVTDYKSKSSTILGCIQIVAGVLILLLCVAIHWYDTTYMTFIMIGHAFSGLIFFCLSGGFAIGAAKRRTVCLFEGYGDDLVDWLSTTPAPFIDDRMPVFKNSFRYSIVPIVLHAGIMMLSLLEFIITIWGSSLACRAMCCTKTNIMTYGHVEAGQVNTVTMGHHPMAPVSAAVPMMQANALPEKEAFKEDNSQMVAPPPYE
ncbi:hypothetical protein LSH36_799g01022 [Paralvinella palmiformis]|uniref:Uncharacterized protein n=1 Tax=Paralvinella palmiformis TaxID=53620 RepID=A0AAD9J0Y7_9ANNE|nr:hypothetical protein LSH36_799g01022 [Paralvinella palmiformis]